jgi:hypothetical protein
LVSQISGRIFAIRIFGLAGYPAGRISCKNSIWCIPNLYAALVLALGGKKKMDAAPALASLGHYHAPTTLCQD